MALLTCGVANPSSLYNEQVDHNLAKSAKGLQAQIMISISDLFDSITIISIVSSFKSAFDTDGIHGCSYVAPVLHGEAGLRLVELKDDALCQVRT